MNYCNNTNSNGKEKKRKKIIRKPHRIVEVKRKINFGMLIMGLIATIIGSYLCNRIYIRKEVRFNGELLNAPIVHMNYGRSSSADVKIQGKVLYVWAVSDDYNVGDSLLVRYDSVKQVVIQEKFQEYHFVMWFGLDAVLLIGGLILVYGGLAKKSWDGV